VSGEIYSESLLDSQIDLSDRLPSQVDAERKFSLEESLKQYDVVSGLSSLREKIQAVALGRSYLEILEAVERAYGKDDISGALARLDVLEDLLDTSVPL